MPTTLPPCPSRDTIDALVRNQALFTAQLLHDLNLDQEDSEDFYRTACYALARLADLLVLPSAWTALAIILRDDRDGKDLSFQAGHRFEFYPDSLSPENREMLARLF